MATTDLAPRRSDLPAARPGRPGTGGPAAPAVPYDEGRNAFSLALLLGIVLMIPTQFSVSPAGLHLTPLRFSLIMLALPGLVMFLSRQPLRVYLFDVFYLAFALWTVLCMVINRGIGPGIERGGQFLLESAVIYLILQGSLRSLSQIRALYAFFFWTSVVLLVFAVPEILLGEHYLFNLFNRITGVPPLEGTLAGERLGILRVTSIFGHPILYGVFNASLFAMLWYLVRSTPARLACVGIVSLGAFLSLSSGPILVTLIQITLIAVEYATRWLKRRAWVIGSIIAAGLIFVHFASNRGLFVLMALFTLEPASAYNRRLIWEHGTDDVLRSPIFGMLPELWTRPFWMKPSIDNFWLFQAMQGGIPSVVFLLLAILLIIRSLYRVPRQELPPALEGLRRGWLYLIIAMVLCGATVHFFDKLQPYFAFVVATGAAAARVISDWKGNPAAAAAANVPDGRRRAAAEPGSATGKPRTWL